MEKSTAWYERVAFAECPYCGETESLGDVLFDDSYVTECPSCRKEYLLDPASDD